MAEGSESTLSVDVWRGAVEGRFQSFQVPRRAHQTILDVVTEIQRDGGMKVTVEGNLVDVDPFATSRIFVTA